MLPWLGCFRGRRTGKEQYQLPAVISILKRRPKPSQRQHQPEEKSHEEEDLPEAAKIHVFIALMTEPESCIEAKHLLYGNPLAGEGAQNHQEERTEERVDADTLKSRFTASRGRSQVESRSQKSCSNPKYRQLDVPCPRNRIAVFSRAGGGFSKGSHSSRRFKKQRQLGRCGQGAWHAPEQSPQSCSQAGDAGLRYPGEWTMMEGKAEKMADTRPEISQHGTLDVNVRQRLRQIPSDGPFIGPSDEPFYGSIR